MGAPGRGAAAVRLLRHLRGRRRHCPASGAVAAGAAAAGHRTGTEPGAGPPPAARAGRPAARASRAQPAVAGAGRAGRGAHRRRRPVHGRPAAAAAVGHLVRPVLRQPQLLFLILESGRAGQRGRGQHLRQRPLRGQRGALQARRIPVSAALFDPAAAGGLAGRRFRGHARPLVRRRCGPGGGHHAGRLRLDRRRHGAPRRPAAAGRLAGPAHPDHHANGQLPAGRHRPGPAGHAAVPAGTRRGRRRRDGAGPVQDLPRRAVRLPAVLQALARAGVEHRLLAAVRGAGVRHAGRPAVPRFHRL